MIYQSISPKVKVPNHTYLRQTEMNNPPNYNDSGQSFPPRGSFGISLPNLFSKSQIDCISWTSRFFDNDGNIAKNSILFDLLIVPTSSFDVMMAKRKIYMDADVCGCHFMAGFPYLKKRRWFRPLLEHIDELLVEKYNQTIK